MRSLMGFKKKKEEKKKKTPHMNYPIPPHPPYAFL
jgi:hypothetical protein